MSKRGWGGPSIREGSHPRPYMSIATDLNECHDILDEIEKIVHSHDSSNDRLQRIRTTLRKKPEKQL